MAFSEYAPVDDGNPLPVTGVSGSLVVASTGYESSASKTRPNDTDAYTAGDVIAKSASAGTVWTFASIGPTAGKVLINFGALEIDVAAVPAGAGNFRMHLYNASPTAINDNAAYDLPSGDRAKYLGYVEVTTPVDLGATLWVQNDTVRLPITLAAASTSIYGILQTVNGYTPTASAVKKFIIKAVRIE